MNSWNLREITGLFLMFLLLDLIIVIFRGLSHKFVWGLTVVLFIIQIIFLFWLNHIRIKDRALKNLQHLYLFLIILGFLILSYIFICVLENMGLGTILSG